MELGKIGGKKHNKVAYLVLYIPIINLITNGLIHESSKESLIEQLCLQEIFLNRVTYEGGSRKIKIIYYGNITI